MEISGVNSSRSIHSHEPSDVHILADFADFSGQCILNSAFSFVGHRHEILQRIRRSFQRFLCQSLNELDEFRILGNKISLGVNLNDSCFAVILVECNSDQTFRCDSVSLLGRLRQTLLTKHVDSLVDVAVSLHQRFLAVHHARAGFISEFLY